VRHLIPPPRQEAYALQLSGGGELRYGEAGGSPQHLTVLRPWPYPSLLSAERVTGIDTSLPDNSLPKKALAKMAYSGKFGSAPKSGEKMKLSAVLEKECQETFASVPVPST